MSLASKFNNKVCNRFVINQETMDSMWNYEVPEGFPYSHKFDPTWSIMMGLELPSEEK